MADVQLTVIDQQDTQIALAVPGIQGATGPTGSVAAAANGTAALPSITFTNDPSTGISYVPTQALAFSVAGVQRAVMSASVFAFGATTGDCGIEVGNGATANRAAYIDLVGDTTYTDYGARFVRNDAGANTETAIFHRGTGPLVLQTQDAGPIRFDTTGTERLRINAGGNVGIGTSAPSQALDVATVGSTNVAVRVRNDAGVADLYVLASGDAFLASQNAGKSLLLGTQGGEKVRIDPAGRLLVGTGMDSGGALFQVNGDRIRVSTAKTPASATATGTTGEICWDANYIYVCTATNTWKRTAIATW